MNSINNSMSPYFDISTFSIHNNQKGMHIYHVAPATSFTTKIRNMLNILKGDTIWHLKIQGIGLTNIYLKMNISYIVDIVEHTWTTTITCRLIQSNLACLEIEKGNDSNILNLLQNINHWI